MAGSPVFSINFTNRLIPAKPMYLMSIENSQAILKYFIDLKSRVGLHPGGVLPYIMYIGMCRPKGYGF